MISQKNAPIAVGMIVTVLVGAISIWTGDEVPQTLQESLPALVTSILIRLHVLEPKDKE